MFRIINEDLISLKDIVKYQDPNIKDIVNNYFNNGINENKRQNIRILLNIVVKIFYLLANVITFECTDNFFNGKFRGYGTSWIYWAGLSNSDAYNYVGIRKFTKAGEAMLPTFGFCDILEAGQDIKHSLVNKHRVVCEISQNIMYHYVLIALWILIVLGIIISVIGIITVILHHVMALFMFTTSEIGVKRVYQKISMRQREYLNFIHKQNLPLYGSLVSRLANDQLLKEVLLKGPNEEYASGMMKKQ